MLWISLWDSRSISSWGNSTSFGVGAGRGWRVEEEEEEENGRGKEIKRQMKVRNM